MKRYAVKIYYDGKNFYGFQFQKDKRTVAGEICSALLKSRLIENLQEALFQAASRTDRGVSALGQTIAFNTKETFSLKRLNAFFPDEIQAWAWVEVPLNFNPRREAKLRTYVYVYPYGGENLELMSRAAKILQEKLVFGSYVGRNGGIYPKTLKELKVKLKGKNIFLTFSSKSFVRGLIRKLVTLLIKIGREEIDLNQLKQFLEARSLELNLPLASPENLILLDIKYRFRFNVDIESKKRLIDKLKKEVCLAELKRICLEKIEKL